MSLAASALLLLDTGVRPAAPDADANRVCIAPASHVEFTLPTQEPSGSTSRTFFAGCDRTTNTLELVPTQEIRSSI